jgi:hypothetical protein
MINLGVEPIEFDTPASSPLVLASRVDIVSAAGKIVLPPDSLAIFSGETV